MQCLTPTLLYTDIDSQCDKLVTDDGHQFTTLTVQVDSTWYDWPFQRYGWCHQILNGSRDLTTPLSGMVCRGLALATVNLPTKLEISISTYYEDVKGDTKCQKWRGSG